MNPAITNRHLKYFFGLMFPISSGVCLTPIDHKRWGPPVLKYILKWKCTASVLSSKICYLWKLQL